MKRIIQQIIDFFRGKRRRHIAWGPGVEPGRAGANAATAIQRIREATHPNFVDRAGRSQHIVPGSVMLHGSWYLNSPWHGGRLIGGYYLPSKRQCYTVHNPADPNDYSNEVMMHETAHDVEHQLGIAPPWHYHEWRQLFILWYNMPATPTPIAPLPGTYAGDIVEVDFADGGCECCVVGDL